MIISVMLDFVLAFIVAIGFAILFNAPARAIVAAGLLGGIGHAVRFVLHEQLGGGIITSTLAGAVAIGAFGIYLAHRIHTPPVVFTMPAAITMIPGLFAYRTMLGWIRIAADNGLSKTEGLITDVAHNFVLTSALLFMLAIGISISALLFRQQSVKNLGVYGRRTKKQG